MIFITLGSQKFQFNRLLKAIDKLIADGKITDEVFAQIGYSDYIPVHFQYKTFLDREEFAEYEEKADIIITHGGTGAIIGAVKKGKKVVAVPRKAIYGEHVDDHQMQLVEQFKELNLICDCEKVEELDEAIEYAKKTEFVRYKSSTEAVVNSIEKYIESI